MLWKDDSPAVLPMEGEMQREKKKKSHWGGARREEKCNEASASNFIMRELPFAKSNRS